MNETTIQTAYRQYRHYMVHLHGSAMLGFVVKSHSCRALYKSQDRLSNRFQQQIQMQKETSVRGGSSEHYIQEDPGSLGDGGTRESGKRKTGVCSFITWMLLPQGFRMLLVLFLYDSS